MVTVSWPSSVADYAEVWRILDLSGLTGSVRLSRNYTKAGFVYLNGNPVLNLKQTVKVGSKFTLELRFPNGRIKSREIMLVSTWNHTGRRSIEPETRNYNG